MWDAKRVKTVSRAYIQFTQKEDIRSAPNKASMILDKSSLFCHKNMVIMLGRCFFSSSANTPQWCKVEIDNVGRLTVKLIADEIGVRPSSYDCPMNISTPRQDCVFEYDSEEDLQ